MSRRYEKFVTASFVENYKRYKNLQNRIDKKADQIVENPYHNTEVLGNQEVDLRGLRSARMGRNFRIIFGISRNAGQNGSVRKILCSESTAKIRKTSPLFS